MRGWVLAAFALAIASVSARAGSVADFYKGRTIQLVVGYGAGGGYDAYARLIAPYLGKYIPGNPNVVVQNMPGAASLRAANYIYKTAPKDGTVIGTFSRDMPLMGVMGGNPNVQFDPRKFTWLGSPSSYANDAYVLWARDGGPITTIEDAQRPGGPTMVLGATGEGATGDDIARLLQTVLDLRMRIVTGYPDTNSLTLAMEQKEIDAHFQGVSSVYATRPQWISPGHGAHPLLQFARVTRDPRLPNVPTARELAHDDRGRALIELAELPYRLSRPFAAPPGLPPERAKALQDAFMAMQKDPQYLAVTRRLKVEVSPIGAVEVTKLLDRLAAAPPDLLAQMRELQTPKTATGR